MIKIKILKGFILDLNTPGCMKNYKRFKVKIRRPDP